MEGKEYSTGEPLGTATADENLSSVMAGKPLGAAVVGEQPSSVIIGEPSAVTVGDDALNETAISSAYAEGGNIQTIGNLTYVEVSEVESLEQFDEQQAGAEVGQEERLSAVDTIAEEFSAEKTVEKVLTHFRFSETKVKYVFSVIYLIVGVLCVSLTSYIGNYFSYIVGAFMAIVGLVQFITAIKTKEYVQTSSNKTAMSLILMALSVLIIVEKSSADTIIAIAWGFLGLFEGAHAFNHAFSRIARSERCIYYLAKGIVETILAFLLLYDPINHLQLHIMVFGINCIFDAITTCPIIKNFLSKK